MTVQANERRHTQWHQFGSRRVNAAQSHRANRVIAGDATCLKETVTGEIKGG